MKLKRLVFILLFVLLAVMWTVSEAVCGPTCTPTGFFRDSINLTALLINPVGPVSGDVNAKGCNIGVYYGPGAKGQVNGANIHGANYFGVVNNGANVQVQNSTVSDIGETPLNGSQHGVAIYFAFGSNARGNIHDNIVWNYQKGGIVVNGPLSNADVHDNTVIGQGPVNYIAQNGIQLGFGAQGNAHNNLVIGNSYTGNGLTASGGILLVGGDCYGGSTQTGSNVQLNVVIGNDVGVWFSNLDLNCNPVTTPTRDQANHNTARNNAVNNTSGNGAIGQGYQAGITDQGSGDIIEENDICGTGYMPVVSPPPFLFAIDVTFTNNPTVRNNKICGDSESKSADKSRFALVSASTGKILPQVIQ